MSIQESLPYKRGVEAAQAAQQLVEQTGHCEELMPCGHCVHSLDHRHGCPDLTEWN